MNVGIMHGKARQDLSFRSLSSLNDHPAIIIPCFFRYIGCCVVLLIQSSKIRTYKLPCRPWPFISYWIIPILISTHPYPFRLLICFLYFHIFFRCDWNPFTFLPAFRMETSAFSFFIIKPTCFPSVISTLYKDLPDVFQHFSSSLLIGSDDACPAT